jgi:tripartite-type tricarboxylate transporter receptor subunit TctC
MLAKRALRTGFAALALSLVAGGSASAEPYPAKPIKIIVPFPAGGGADATARVIADHLSRTFSQQVHIENRAGSGGLIGTEAAARGEPDGYTVLITTDSVTSTPHVLKSTFDPLKDLLPVVQLTRQPVALAAHPSLGVSSVRELIAFAKQQPGLSYATSGLGSPQSIAPQWFARIAGIELQAVPYRGGGPAINDLIAGHVKVGSVGSAPLIPHYRAGTIRLLAQTTEKRSPALPDVPTYQEAGVPGLVLDQWFGVFVRAGTAPAVVARINAAINKALADATIRANFMQQAQEPVGGSAEQFAELVRVDFAKYARLVKELNIKAE